MNYYRKLNSYIASLGAMMLCASASAAGVNIEWIDPEDYSDLNNTGEPEASFEAFSEEMERYIDKIADRYLPDGAQLQLSIENVDLAGEIEPWHIPPYNDVRVMRDIYAPRVEFDYQLTTPDGENVSGSTSISDMMYQNDIGQRFFDEDSFYYEKQLLADWIRNELAEQVD